MTNENDALQALNCKRAFDWRQAFWNTSERIQPPPWLPQGRMTAGVSEERRQQLAALLYWLALADRDRFPPISQVVKGRLPYLRACAAVATEASGALGWLPESYLQSSGLKMHGWLRNQTHALPPQKESRERRRPAERFRRIRADSGRESGV